MILQSLVNLYEALEKKGEISSPGWCVAKVSFALSLSKEGDLLGVIPLKQTVPKGKKTVEEPQVLEVPLMTARSSGISPNFLCDNSSYILGIDNKGKVERSKECFMAAREKHLEMLKKANGITAEAIMHYFEKWQPEQADEHPALKALREEIISGGNLIFCVEGLYAQEDQEIKQVWNDSYRTSRNATEGICLVTGQKTEIARTHGLIKGVRGAQSSGASLVSFNAPAFESYGKEQGSNAPVGSYAAYAYTTALNYLIADTKHKTVLGDTTIVYWAEDGDEVYQNVFSSVSEPKIENQALIDGVFKNLEEGKAIVVEDVKSQISLEQKFYILGLAPNAARLAVRFFYEDSFGNILNNIHAHYERMKVVRPANDALEYMGIWRMLYETVNKKSQDKSPVSSMAASVYRAILSNGYYPETLFQSTMGRIRAEQDDSDNHNYKITRGRAAIIRAFLIKNRKKDEEEISMALNEENNNVAYILGREFALLEQIQQVANPGINATIKDKYFNSACATPATIFPILFKLKNSHIRKMDPFKDNPKYFEIMLGELQNKLYVEENQKNFCPRSLSLEEQGMFILGYYHQTQKRYEKKNKEEV